MRVPQHIHPPLEFARRAGRNSKDEAYYFPPGVDMGPHPESFLGLHPSLDRDRLWGELVDAVRDWNDDRVLRHSPAYVQVPEEGFFIPSGVLHAPGTALTIELQEDSDSMAMFQALNAGAIISKRLLMKDVSEADRAEHGETAPLHWIDWDANTDPYFYDNHRLVPLPLRRRTRSERGVDLLRVAEVLRQTAHRRARWAVSVTGERGLQSLRLARRRHDRRSGCRRRES